MRWCVSYDVRTDDGWVEDFFMTEDAAEAQIWRVREDDDEVRNVIVELSGADT